MQQFTYIFIFYVTQCLYVQFRGMCLSAGFYNLQHQSLSVKASFQDSFSQMFLRLYVMISQVRSFSSLIKKNIPLLDQM